MKPFQQYILSAVFLTSLLASNATSQVISPESLVRETLEKNPELNFYRAEIAAAKGSLKTARTIANPELTTQGAYKNAHDKSGALVGEGGVFEISIAQTFEYPGRIELRKAIAGKDIRLAELRLEQFQSALVARVRGAAYQVIVAQEASAAASAVADRLSDLATVLKERDPAGITALLEMRIIETSAFGIRHKANDAAIAAKAATVELNQLCGRSATATTEVRIAQLSFDDPPPSQTLIAAAYNKAFDLRIGRAELEQQGFKVSLAKNERYPAVTIAPFFSREKSGESQNIAGVGLSLPLPLWNRNAGSIETAEARAKQAESGFASKQREVERRVTEAALILEAKLRELHDWQGDLPEQFKSAAKTADEHYRLGAIPVATYVELQKQYLEAIETISETKKEALKAAQELEILTGFKLYRLQNVEIEP